MEGGSLDAMSKSGTQASKDFPIANIERVWQSLFHIMEAMLKRKGGNNFALPHVGIPNITTIENLVVKYR